MIILDDQILLLNSINFFLLYIILVYMYSKKSLKGFHKTLTQVEKCKNVMKLMYHLPSIQPILAYFLCNYNKRITTDSSRFSFSF